MIFSDKKSKILFGIFAVFILSIGFGSGYWLVKNVIQEKFANQLGLRHEQPIAATAENSIGTTIKFTDSILIPAEASILETGSADELTTFMLDTLDVLKLYYLASIEIDPQYYPGYPESEPEALYVTKATEHIKTAEAKLNKYADFKNHNINFVFEKMLESSQIVLNSIDSYMDIRKKLESKSISEEEALKEVGEVFDWQSVGFAGIALVTQINLDSVVVEFRKPEERVGVIPYKITKEQRMTILDKIEELFSDELLAEDKKSSHRNPILMLGVNGLKAHLSFETYEELKGYNYLSD